MEAAGSPETSEMSLRLHGDIPQNTDLSVLCHTAIRLRKITFKHEALNLKSAPQFSHVRRQIAGFWSIFTLLHQVKYIFRLWVCEARLMWRQFEGTRTAEIGRQADSLHHEERGNVHFPVYYCVITWSSMRTRDFHAALWSETSNWENQIVHTHIDNRYNWNGFYANRVWMFQGTGSVWLNIETSCGPLWLWTYE